MALIWHLQLLALVILIRCFINSGYHKEFHITETNLKYVNFPSINIDLHLRQSWISVMSQKSCKGWGGKKNTTFRGRQSPSGTLSPPHMRKHGPAISVFMFADVAPLDVKGEDRKADESWSQQKARSHHPSYLFRLCMDTFKFNLFLLSERNLPFWDSSHNFCWISYLQGNTVLGYLFNHRNIST